MPNCEPHPNGFNLAELWLLQMDIFSQLAKSACLEQISKEYGLSLVLELKKVMSKINRQGLESNEGKFSTTSIKDPRRL
jgi:hypothetical protein